ncbi:MAG: hypothetical protein R3D33_00405 [Hyphomicrobiaceae bacterium]
MNRLLILFAGLFFLALAPSGASAAPQTPVTQSILAGQTSGDAMLQEVGYRWCELRRKCHRKWRCHWSYGKLRCGYRWVCRKYCVWHWSSGKKKKRKYYYHY